MRKIFLFLLLPLCGLAQKGDKEFKLEGELNLGRPVDWVYLRYSAGDNMVTDSFQVPTGKFKYEGRIAEPTVATLMVKYVAAEGEEKPRREAVQLFLEPTKMKLTAKDSLTVFSLTGSGAHADFAGMQKKEQAFSERLAPLYQDYTRARKEGDKAALQKLEHEIKKVDSQMKEEVYGAFLKSSPRSAAALYALKQYAGWDIDAGKIDPLFATLAPAVKDYPSAKAFKAQLDIARKTSIGQLAMDFTQNDTLGKPVSLSSFRGKYVLVDFWASWCGPCRVENPNVVKAYELFKDKNFTVLGVSLDREGQKDRWLKAIHDDHLTWTHVSDLKFWDNEVAKLYGIRAIPQNLLIDPQGKIVARNIRGEELQQKLQEIIR